MSEFILKHYRTFSEELYGKLMNEIKIKSKSNSLSILIKKDYIEINNIPSYDICALLDLNYDENKIIIQRNKVYIDDKEIEPEKIDYKKLLTIDAYLLSVLFHLKERRDEYELEGN